MQFTSIPWQGSHASIEYQWLGPEQSDFPPVVFLHEGLGSISMWRDFPQRFCEEHGFRGLVFSRIGYGQSTPRPLDAPLKPDYLHRQAHEALPALLAALNVEKPWIFGHSDGGSIALLYGARFSAHTSGLVVLAPHIFVEDITIAGILEARDAYRHGDLKPRLARHHRDVESVFRGWNDAWLDPAFRNWNIEAELPKIACPVLAMQGEQDEYATLAQIHGIERLAPHARALAIADCGHSPHFSQPAAVSRAAASFIKDYLPRR
ncbi:alpha/beta fold hydrolase [Noviherbaspirillum denitrificans]|nr:alpha/beta hydrolase [Noviherbaspirillum denitrificans]